VPQQAVDYVKLNKNSRFDQLFAKSISQSRQTFKQSLGE